MEPLKCQANLILPVDCDHTEVKQVTLSALSEENKAITLNLCPKHIDEASALPGYQIFTGDFI